MAGKVQLVGSRSEVDVVVFVFGGPIAGEGLLDADACGPAEMFEGFRGDGRALRVVDVDAGLGPSNAPRHIGQHGPERVADTGAPGGEIIEGGIEGTQVQSRPVYWAAERDVRLEAENDAIGVLQIVPGLIAAHEPSDAVG